jgi:hypothetical protein
VSCLPFFDAVGLDVEVDEQCDLFIGCHWVGDIELLDFELCDRDVEVCCSNEVVRYM